MYGNCIETAPVAKAPRPSPKCTCARLRRGTPVGNSKVRTARAITARNGMGVSLTHDYGAERGVREGEGRFMPRMWFGSSSRMDTL